STPDVADEVDEVSRFPIQTHTIGARATAQPLRTPICYDQYRLLVGASGEELVQRRPGNAFGEDLRAKHFNLLTVWPEGVHRVIDTATGVATRVPTVLQRFAEEYVPRVEFWLANGPRCGAGVDAAQRGI